MKDYLRTNAFARRIRELLYGIWHSTSNPTRKLVKILVQSEIQTVLDVGANTGQFGVDLRRSGYLGKIHSFEPVASTFGRLTEVASRYPNWEVWQLGLGDETGSREINVSGNSALSSSFLDMGELHKKNFPKSETVYREKVLISTVDTEVSRLEIIPKFSLLKIDTQGFEYFVLKGASSTLSQFTFCYLEVSLLPLYEGEKSFLDILLLLSEFGHHVVEINSGVRGINRELLQVDILTRRR